MGVCVVRIVGLRSYYADCLECDVKNTTRSNVSRAVILKTATDMSSMIGFTCRIADVGYTVIARTYGAIDPLASAVAAHPADMEDGIDMRLIRDESLSNRSRQ